METGAVAEGCYCEPCVTRVIQWRLHGSDATVIEKLKNLLFNSKYSILKPMPCIVCDTSRLVIHKCPLCDGDICTKNWCASRCTECNQIYACAHCLTRRDLDWSFCGECSINCPSCDSLEVFPLSPPKWECSSCRLVFSNDNSRD